MLEGLDVIDWSSLSHAHGPATDVPRLLRSLLSNDTDVRLEACDELHERIWHQGTVYSASAAVVPFLFELLNRPVNRDEGGAPARRANRGDAEFQPGADEIAVSLLGCIATGEGWIQYGIRAVGEAAMRSTLARQGRSLEEARTEERSTLEAIHRGVAAGLPRLLPYLGNQEGLGALVAETLGNFPEHSDWLAPAIDAALLSESNEHIRQNLIESKARLTKR
ncbi:MAG TPA: hypothetical protein VHC19_13590 [Pirellulales bacterium]|jgi:hypothetical protein|nr:hypothetical protein [Pirellulales bacterium]